MEPLSEQVAALEAERDILKANQGVDPEYKVNYERLAAKYDGALRRAVDAESALAAAERQALAQRQRAETAERNEAVLRLRVKVAEESERTARVEGARVALTRLSAQMWAQVRPFPNDSSFDECVLRFRDREYPATGEEPTRGEKPNLGMPYTRCRACDSLRDWEGRCDDCDGPRPAPPAVTEPPRVSREEQRAANAIVAIDQLALLIANYKESSERVKQAAECIREMLPDVAASRPTASGEG